MPSLASSILVSDDVERAKVPILTGGLPVVIPTRER